MKTKTVILLLCILLAVQLSTAKVILFGEADTTGYHQEVWTTRVTHLLDTLLATGDEVIQIGPVFQSDTTDVTCSDIGNVVIRGNGNPIVYLTTVDKLTFVDNDSWVWDNCTLEMSAWIYNATDWLFTDCEFRSPRWGVTASSTAMLRFYGSWHGTFTNCTFTSTNPSLIYAAYMAADVALTLKDCTLINCGFLATNAGTPHVAHLIENTRVLGGSLEFSGKMRSLTLRHVLISGGRLIAGSSYEGNSVDSLWMEDVEFRDYNSVSTTAVYGTGVKWFGLSDVRIYPTKRGESTLSGIYLRPSVLTKDSTLAGAYITECTVSREFKSGTASMSALYVCNYYDDVQITHNRIEAGGIWAVSGNDSTKNVGAGWEVAYNEILHDPADMAIDHALHFLAKWSEVHHNTIRTPAHHLILDGDDDTRGTYGGATYYYAWVDDTLGAYHNAYHDNTFEEYARTDGHVQWGAVLKGQSIPFYNNTLRLHYAEGSNCRAVMLAGVNNTLYNNLFEIHNQGAATAYVFDDGAWGGVESTGIVYANNIVAGDPVDYLFYSSSGDAQGYGEASNCFALAYDHVDEGSLELSARTCFSRTDWQVMHGGLAMPGILPSQPSGAFYPMGPQTSAQADPVISRYQKGWETPMKALANCRSLGLSGITLPWHVRTWADQITASRWFDAYADSAAVKAVLQVEIEN